MKYLFLSLIITLDLAAQTLTPVAFVSPQKFSGLWYEIARTYNSYQEKCVASSVEYRLIAPLEYKVFNRCFDTAIGGDLIEYIGSAEPTQGKSMSSIDMTYFWVFTKEYSVYYLAEDYSYAVVADKDFEQVWIMSRKPFMPQEKLSEILAYLTQSMDTKSLLYTPQDKEGRYK
ncbi:MAG: lipocalin family protein [Sulfurimonas sp.]|nr:lipocalin family protein [Sulfurimonas sp.]